MMRQDILCRGIVRVSRVCMHSNEPFIMGCVVCVRCVPPVDTTAHRVDKAPHPARRRAAEVRSSPASCRAIPELAVASAVTRVVPARARGGAPVTTATAPGERDLAPYRADLEFSNARTARRRRRARAADRVTRGAAGHRRARPVLAPRFLARSNEVSCRHQKSTSQFQIRMRRRLRATDNSRTATGARRWPAWGRPEGETERLRPVRVRPGTCYIQLHRL